MDPRRPLSSPAVLEEFVSLFWTDLHKRPELLEWLRRNVAPSKLRALNDAIISDNAQPKPPFGYAVEARLKVINSL
jgi:hypothetical protein